MNAVLVTEKLLLIDTYTFFWWLLMWECSYLNHTMFLGDKETGLSAPYVRYRTYEGPVHIDFDHKLVAWLLALSDPVPGIIIPCINDALLWISQARLSSSLSKTITLGVTHSPCFINYGTAWNDCCCSEGLGSPSGSRLSLHPFASCSSGSSHTGPTIRCCFTLFF
jgi:hypothetical protein